ncbi:MAG: alpha-ketoglutarate-dependent dioxygenase AlkB [Acidimicrobiales bacterium]|jgi:alkylated DNA repair dioxygenase AlkB
MTAATFASPSDHSGPIARPLPGPPAAPISGSLVPARTNHPSTFQRWLSPDARVERIRLDDRSWVDVVRGLVAEPDRVHREVLTGTRWRQGKVFRYERWIDDPRLSATVSGTRRHPALAAVETWLARRYRVRFSGLVLAQYRDERDALGFHRDTGMTWVDDTLVAVLSLGARRPWYLRPDTGRPVDGFDDQRLDVIDVDPSGGDLLVMGGACQKEWLHAVPPVAGAVGNRVSAQWRWAARRGEPDQSLRHRDAWRFTRR